MNISELEFKEQRRRDPCADSGCEYSFHAGVTSTVEADGEQMVDHANSLDDWVRTHSTESAWVTLEAERAYRNSNGPFCLHSELWRLVVRFVSTADAATFRLAYTVNGEVPLSVGCNVPVQTYAKTNGIGHADDIVPETTFAIDGEFTFVYDYPLSGEARFAHTLVRPTARELLRLGALDYQRIYDEEAASASPPLPGGGNLVNRPTTKGKYGIWGHGIGDLAFESLEVYPLAKQIRFGIGS
jgi:hypothetical protein